VQGLHWMAGGVGTFGTAAVVAVAAVAAVVAPAGDVPPIPTVVSTAEKAMAIPPTEYRRFLALAFTDHPPVTGWAQREVVWWESRTRSEGRPRSGETAAGGDRTGFARAGLTTQAAPRQIGPARVAPRPRPAVRCPIFAMY
jgi:hypothetical protein